MNSTTQGVYAHLNDEFLPTEPPSTGQAYFDLVLIFPAVDANSDAVERADSDAVEKATTELKLKRPSFQGLPGGPKRQREIVAARARSIGIEAVADLSRDRDEVLLKLSAPDALLEKMAERLTMEKRLKADRRGREGYYTDFKAFSIVRCSAIFSRSASGADSLSSTSSRSRERSATASMPIERARAATTSRCSFGPPGSPWKDGRFSLSSAVAFSTASMSACSTASLFASTAGKMRTRSKYACPVLGSAVCRYSSRRA